MVRQFMPICYVEGIKPQKSLNSGTHKWREILQEIQKSARGKEDGKTKDSAKKPAVIVDVTAFNSPPLADFLAVMSADVKVEIRIHDYDVTLANLGKKIFWIATIRKIYGYMLLLRFEGMDREGDEKHDFWINIGSEELRHVGFCASSSDCELIPPDLIRKRQTDWPKYMLCKLHACKTLTVKWPEEQRRAITDGKFTVGQRLELLDRLESTRVRPARIIQQLGRRICVRVSSEDMLSTQLETENDLQVLDGVWLDECSGLLFPVGWAACNGYGLQANDAYIKHCAAIAEAVKAGRAPSYDPLDVSHDKFRDWNENKANDNAIHWEKGWKFECLDPLNSSFLELRVATCVEILNDGYIKIGFDGPEMEEESLPIHCTSPLLFPTGYGAEYNICVRGPAETSTEFSWKEYLRQCQAIAAPSSMFDPVPPADFMKKFQIGGKLEATDMCEPNLVCPATVVDVKGRLLRVHFDGWEENIDQLFDYRSRDIFPIGWCEMFGYKMENPKKSVNGPPNAKKRRK